MSASTMWAEIQANIAAITPYQGNDPTASNNYRNAVGNAMSQGIIDQLFVPIDNTGAPADITLGVNQVAFINVSAATSALLHIATATDQVYEIMLNGVVAVSAATPTLLPNNTNYGSVYTYREIFASGGTIAGGAANSAAGSNIAIDSATFSSKTTLFTSTNKKSWISSSGGSSSTNSYIGTIEIEWQDTTTVWSSLGTVDFAAVAWTGRIWIKRVG